MQQASSLHADSAQGPLRLDSRARMREVGIELAEQARRELLLFAPRLDADLYDQAPFLETVRRLALANPHQPVRILVAEARAIARDGHRLIELARHLSSRIALREIDERDQERRDAFLIVDARGYLYRQIAASHKAVAEMNGRRTARRLREEFNQLWEIARESSELRRLYL